VVIERLGPNHDRQSFTCGEEMLDKYLRQQAGQDAGRGLAVTYVAVEGSGESAILGYYTLTMSCVQPEIMPEKRVPPKRAVPVVLLGRLAVSQNAQGRGLGEILLMDALRRSERLSAKIGSFAVVVDVLHEKARNFYLRYGFRELGDSPLHLYVTMKDIRKLGLNATE
jgi:GNAT superfamily N-acetyltransferase